MVPNAEKILSKAETLFKKIGRKAVPDEIKNTLKSYGFSKEVISQFEIKYTFENVVNEFQGWLKRSDFSKGEKFIDFFLEFLFSIFLIPFNTLSTSSLLLI